MKTFSIFPALDPAPTLSPAAITAALAAIPNQIRRPVRHARPRVQRSPDRQRSLERRRSLAGYLPAILACHFTEGERAVLGLVGEEVRRHGVCDRSLAELAARAGVSRSTAKNALRQAARLRLVTIEERRRRGAKNLTNLVRVVDPTWRAWLDRGQKFHYHGDSYLTKGEKRAGDRPTRLPSHSRHRPAGSPPHSAHSSG